MSLQQLIRQFTYLPANLLRQFTLTPIDQCRQTLNRRNLCSANSKNEVESSKSTSESSTTQSQADNKLCSLDGEWHISCGLVIQRFPLVVPEFNVIEQCLYDSNLKLEYEKSLLNEYDYAIQKVRIENSKEEKYLQLVSNYERFVKENESFKVLGKKTEDDLNNDLKSYQRCLDQSLFLVTKLNVGKKPLWTFPFAVLNKEDESLREACDRLLEQIDDRSKFRILGNSPFVYEKYAYPSKVRERLNKKGNKIFYFKCELIDLQNKLNIVNKSLIQDYKWLTDDACSKEMSALWKLISKGIFVENMDDTLLNIVNRKLSEKKIELSNS